MPHYDSKFRAKCRKLYESGKALRAIARDEGVAFNSVRIWAKKGKWVKGRLAPILEQKEQEKTIAEAERHGVTKARWLLELGSLAFSNIQDFTRVKAGKVVMRDFSKISKSQAAAIRKIKQKSLERVSAGDKTELVENELEFTLHDKVKSLEMVGRHLGLFNDKLALSAGGEAYSELVERFRKEGRE